MHLKGIFKVVVALLLVVAVVGCGSGNSETNGTLKLNATVNTDTAAKTVSVHAIALLTPIQVGSEVTFVTTMFNGGGALPLPAECSGKAKTDTTGNTTPIVCNFTLPGPAATLQITALAGSLRDVMEFPIAAAP